MTFFPAPDFLTHTDDCPLCNEKWCNLCDMHWGNCNCPGPGFRACAGCKEIFVGRLTCEVCGDRGEPI